MILFLNIFKGLAGDHVQTPYIALVDFLQSSTSFLLQAIKMC